MVGAKTDNDLDLVNAIVEHSRNTRVQVVPLNKRGYARYGLGHRLDHGVLVPLYYLRKHGFDAQMQVVNIGFLPYSDLYLFGKAIAEAAFRHGRKIGVLAFRRSSPTGMQPGAPAGYNKQARCFDELPG